MDATQKDKMKDKWKAMDYLKAKLRSLYPIKTGRKNPGRFEVSAHTSILFITQLLLQIMALTPN